MKLNRAKNYKKLQADKKSWDVQLEEGDLALVKLQPQTKFCCFDKKLKIECQTFWTI